MSKNVVSSEMDLDNSPGLTEEQKARLLHLAQRPDTEIDYSDIPPLTDEHWANAAPFRSASRKASTSIDVDPDVLDWFRQQGNGFSARMNEVLRREMLSSQEQNSEPLKKSA